MPLKRVLSTKRTSQLAHGIWIYNETETDFHFQFFNQKANLKPYLRIQNLHAIKNKLLALTIQIRRASTTKFRFGIKENMALL